MTTVSTCASIANVTREQPVKAVPGSLAVREILAFDLLADARVLAGASGLERRVHRLNMMTVPDIVRWTKDHELLLTTGYPLPNAPGELIRLFTALDERGVAAVGVKYGSYGPGLMPEVLLHADGLGLPIIDIPEAVAFDDLLSHVLSHIANRQAAALARAQEIHEALLRIFLGGGDLDDIARELSIALGGAGVICVDVAGRVLAEAAAEPHWRVLRGDGMLDADGAVVVGRLTSSVARARLVTAPVLAGSLQHGHLIAVPGSATLPPEAEVMVQQSAMVAALDITKRLAVSSVERHFESNAIHDLLTGSEQDVRDVVSRAGSFGWDLDRRLVVLVARRDPTSTDAGHGELRQKHDIDAWVAAVRRADRTAAAGGLGRDLVAVCGVGDGRAPTARLVAEGVKDTTRRSFSVGASSVVTEPHALPTGYQHARTALDIAQKTRGAGAVMPYEALGLYRLLNAVSDRGELQAFVDEVLGDVLARPAEERADLLGTLDVLLANQLNVAESARILHFHYNTMRYRITKLRKLVGPFTTDSQLCLRLSVALEILHMWEMSDTVGS